MKEVNVTEREEEIAVTLCGEIDSGNADAFFGEVKSAFEEGKKDVHFFCKDLTFIDSTTLGAFVKITKMVSAEGKKVRLSELQPKIRKLFSICVLDKMMEIDD